MIRKNVRKNTDGVISSGFWEKQAEEALVELEAVEKPAGDGVVI